MSTSLPYCPANPDDLLLSSYIRLPLTLGLENGFSLSMPLKFSSPPKLHFHASPPDPPIRLSFSSLFSDPIMCVSLLALCQMKSHTCLISFAGVKFLVLGDLLLSIFVSTGSVNNSLSNIYTME